MVVTLWYGLIDIDECRSKPDMTLLGELHGIRAYVHDNLTQPTLYSTFRQHDGKNRIDGHRAGLDYRISQPSKK